MALTWFSRLIRFESGLLQSIPRLFMFVGGFLLSIVSILIAFDVLAFAVEAIFWLPPLALLFSHLFWHFVPVYGGLLERADKYLGPDATAGQKTIEYINDDKNNFVFWILAWISIVPFFVLPLFESSFLGSYGPIIFDTEGLEQRQIVGLAICFGWVSFVGGGVATISARVMVSQVLFIWAIRHIKNIPSLTALRFFLLSLVRNALVFSALFSFGIALVAILFDLKVSAPPVLFLIGLIAFLGMGTYSIVAIGASSVFANAKREKALRLEIDIHEATHLDYLSREMHWHTMVNNLSPLLDVRTGLRAIISILGPILFIVAEDPIKGLLAF